jgi:hypothetical protein
MDGIASVFGCVSQRKQVANLAQGEAEVLRVTDEADLRNNSDPVFAVTGFTALGYRQQPLPLVESDGRNLDARSTSNIAYE